MTGQQKTTPPVDGKGCYADMLIQAAAPAGRHLPSGTWAI
jgi:hypothetical protein